MDGSSRNKIDIVGVVVLGVGCIIYNDGHGCVCARVTQSWCNDAEVFNGKGGGIIMRRLFQC